MYGSCSICRRFCDALMNAQQSKQAEILAEHL